MQIIKVYKWIEIGSTGMVLMAKFFLLIAGFQGSHIDSSSLFIYKHGLDVLYSTFITQMSLRFIGQKSDEWC